MDTFQRRQISHAAVQPASTADARYRQGVPASASRLKEPALDAAKVERIAAAARDRDRAALKTLFDLFKDRIYRIALMLLSSHATAEAITEEVFVRYFTSPPPGAPPFERWALRKAVRICVRNMEEGAGSERERLSVDEPERGTAIRRRIAGKLAKLPAASRVAFVLGEGAGFSYDEISEIMDVAQNDVPALLAEARMELASVLETIEFESWNAG